MTNEEATAILTTNSITWSSPDQRKSITRSSLQTLRTHRSRTSEIYELFLELKQETLEAIALSPTVSDSTWLNLRAMSNTVEHLQQSGRELHSICTALIQLSHLPSFPPTPS